MLFRGSLFRFSVYIPIPFWFMPMRKKKKIKGEKTSRIIVNKADEHYEKDNTLLILIIKF